MAIQNNSFFQNAVLANAFTKAKETKKKVHLAGLLTEGHVHAAFEHIDALLEYAKQSGVEELYLHIFTDGKDGPQKGASALVQRLQSACERYGLGTIASISGRHYALDRDSHYDRTEAAYKAMTGELPQSEKSVLEVIAAAYENNETDEHIEPTVLSLAGKIDEGDSLIFFDYREDSIRQIASSFLKPDFNKFPVKRLALNGVTFTNYGKEFQTPVAFPQEDITMPLARVLSEAGKKQLQVAETEKYAHVSYFFNGFRDESFSGQEKILIPSNNVDSHAQKPEMKAGEITTTIIDKIESGIDFVVANFANADILAHTGNYDATLQTIKTIDEQLERLVKLVEEKDIVLVVTADHGNAEVLIDPIKGTVQTGHDPSPVPLYVIGKEFQSKKSAADAEAMSREVVGVLSDVAPTILEIFGIPKPAEMKGESLLDIIR